MKATELMESAEAFRTPMASGPRPVESISDYGRFLALAPEWNRLVEESGIEHPFLRHEWLRVWWECFGQDSRLEVLVQRDERGLAAAAPLMRNRVRMFGFPLRRWQSIYNVHTPRAGFIVRPGEDGAWRAIWEHIAERRSEWDVVELDQLPAGSRTLDEVARFAEGAGLPVGSWWSGDAPYVRLAGGAGPGRAGWDAYFQSLGRKHRSNMRNRVNRLNKIGKADLDLVTESGPALDAALEEGLRIEAAAWKGQSGTAIRSDGHIQDFYAKFALAAAREGMLRLHFLKVGDRRVAFAYALVYRNRLYLLKTGYDPAYSQFSPFNVLCMKVIEDAFEQGIEEYDFLGVHDPWKRSWTETARPHYWLYVFSGSLYSRSVYQAKFNLIPRVRNAFRFHPSTPSSSFSFVDGGER